MRITACRIEAFGPFHDRVLDDLDHPVVVVQGPNEAGKSSLFYFFREMLYGIEPPAATRHPYARVGDAPPLGGQLRYRGAEGPHHTVYRRLLETPQARLRKAGDEPPMDLQNRPLPSVAHVSREVFSAVYALNEHTLGDLSGAAREEVQARLLHMAEAPHVRPAAGVADVLDAEAARLWAPSANADEEEPSTEAGRLLVRRRALRDALREAREHDRQHRAARRAMQTCSDRLDALADERADLKAHLRRAERLRPVRALLTQMETHAERADDLAPFDDLPDDPGPALERLGEDVEHYENEAHRNAQARADAQAIFDAFSEADRRVEDRAEAIRTWANKAPAHERRAAHRDELLRDIEQIGSTLDERARRHFGVAWSDDLRETLRAVPEDELERRADAYRQIDAEVDALEVRADALARKVDRRRRLWPWGVVAGGGVAVLVAGVAVALPLLWGLGLAALLGGLAQALYAWSYNRERTERLGEIDLEIEERKEKRFERSAALAEVLAPLSLDEDEAARPDDDLTDALREMRRQAEEQRALRRQADALAAALAEEEQAVATLAERCGLENGSEASLAKGVAALEQRLDAAEARHRRADEAEDRLKRLNQRRREIEPALEERRERRAALLKALRRLAPPSSAGESADEKSNADARDASKTAALIGELEARRRAACRAEQVRETLFREHPDWKARREEIRALEADGDGWSYADADVVRLRERRDAVSGEIDRLEDERADERQEAERHARASFPADVASKLAAVERRLADAGRRRDRLALLAGVLRRADRAFRRKHQPEAVQQAGRYLRTITGGRYCRLVLQGKEDRLHVCRTRAAGPTAESEPQRVAPPLSRGLRDQIHLALRLALLDRLDQEQEALPVFLDEVFTTWDRTRRQHAYDVIEELSGRRQVFVFTCHPVLSEELIRRLDAHRLLLQPTLSPERHASHGHSARKRSQR